MQKVEKKRKDSMLREVAVNNKKIRTKLEKEDALKKLGKNRNVQIIGAGSKGSKGVGSNRSADRSFNKK